MSEEKPPTPDPIAGLIARWQLCADPSVLQCADELSALHQTLTDARSRLEHERDMAWGELGFIKNDLSNAVYRAEHAEAERDDYKKQYDELARACEMERLLSASEATQAALREALAQLVSHAEDDTDDRRLSEAVMNARAALEPPSPAKT